MAEGLNADHELYIFEKNWEHRNYAIFSISCLFTLICFLALFAYLNNPAVRFRYIDLLFPFIDGVYILICCGSLLLIGLISAKIEEHYRLKKFRINASKYLTHANPKVRKHAQKCLKNT